MTTFTGWRFTEARVYLRRYIIYGGVNVIAGSVSNWSIVHETYLCFQTKRLKMNIESQARWYAIKLILKYFSILAAVLIIGYIDPFYMVVAVGVMLALIIAGAIYRDAYYDKLWELKKNEQPNTRTGSTG